MVGQTADGTAARIRVLHVIDHLWGGGAEASLASYLEAVADDSAVEPIVVCLAGDPKSIDIAATLPTQVVTGRHRERIGPADVLLVRRAIRQHRPSMIHSSLIRSDLAVGLTISGLPHLVTVTDPLIVQGPGDVQHGSLRRLVQRFVRIVWRCVLARRNVYLHAVSSATAKALMADRIVRHNRIWIILRGRATPDPLPDSVVEATRAALRLPPKATTVLMLAREVPRKDHALFLRAAATLKAANEPFIFLMAGQSGASTPDIDELIAKLHLGNHVRRLGHREDVDALLAVADVLVSTSRAEGAPGGIIEALAVGKPVLAVSAPGVDEVLGADYPGLVSERSHTSLAARLLEFRHDSRLADDLALRGRERHRAALTLPQYVERMHLLYGLIVTSSARLVPHGGPWDLKTNAE